MRVERGWPGRALRLMAAPSILAAASSAITPPASAAAQSVWQVVSHDVSFVIRNATLPVHGSFEDADFTVVFDPADPGSAELSGSIDPASIRTGIALRDRHLAGRQFFDVRRYPAITMHSAAVETSTEPGSFDGTFELTIRDVTKEVPVRFLFDRAGGVAMLVGSMTIDRVEYGVGDGGFVLGDDVTVTVALTLTPPP